MLLIGLICIIHISIPNIEAVKVAGDLNVAHILGKIKDITTSVGSLKADGLNMGKEQYVSRKLASGHAGRCEGKGKSFVDADLDLSPIGYPMTLPCSLAAEQITDPEHWEVWEEHCCVVETSVDIDCEFERWGAEISHDGPLNGSSISNRWGFKTMPGWYPSRLSHVYVETESEDDFTASFNKIKEMLEAGTLASS